MLDARFLNVSITVLKKHVMRQTPADDHALRQVVQTLDENAYISIDSLRAAIDQLDGLAPLDRAWFYAENIRADKLYLLFHSAQLLKLPAKPPPRSRPARTLALASSAAPAAAAAKQGAKPIKTGLAAALVADPLPSTPLEQVRFKNIKQPGKATLEKLANFFTTVADLAKANEASGKEAKERYRKKGKIRGLEDLIAECRAICGSTDAADSSLVPAVFNAASPKRRRCDDDDDGDEDEDEDGSSEVQSNKRSR